MKKILVAVTGMSPQIVTETLFALVTLHQWIPDEIHVLTTRLGAQHLRSTLLENAAHFHQFCAQYATPDISFSKDNIHLICDEQEQILDDIRTPEQNNAAADMIVRFVHDLCAQDDTELHVSIAGGRKSMGFYIGYALSLFGRRRDRLSHVLVNEPFENHPDFFYPTRSSHWIATSSGMIDARDAQVMLADIPFVRMRDGLPHVASESDWTYLQAVEQTQRRMDDWHIEMDSEFHTLHCASQTILLTPQQFALYAAMVSLKMEERSIRSRVPEDMACLLQRYIRCYPVSPTETSQQLQERLTKNCHADMLRILQEASSQIYRKLRKALGEQRAKHFRIVGSGRNNNRSYTLNASNQQFSFRRNISPLP